MIKFTVDISGEKEVDRILNATIKKCKNFREVLERIANDLYQTETYIFEFEGAYEGRQKWAQLSSGYAETKGFTYPGGKILQSTGMLKESLTKRGGRGTHLRITNNEIEFGSNVMTEGDKYNLSALHQKGWTKPEIVPTNKKALHWLGAGGASIFAKRSRSVKVPARPPISVSNIQKERWMKFFNEFFQAGMVKK